MRRYLQRQYKPICVITMLYVNQYQKVSIVALCIDIVNTCMTIHEVYTPFPLVWRPPLAITCTAVEGRGQRNPINGKMACMSLLHIFLT